MTKDLTQGLTKLYNLPRETYFKFPKDDEVFFFQKVDGMYSICKTADGKIFHLAAWTEVEVIGDA